MLARDPSAKGAKMRGVALIAAAENIALVVVMVLWRA